MGKSWSTPGNHGSFASRLRLAPLMMLWRITTGAATTKIASDARKKGATKGHNEVMSNFMVGISFCHRFFRSWWR
jgi:hypothetical protein